MRIKKIDKVYCSFVIFLIGIFTTQLLFSQEEVVPSYFGLQVKPLIPSNFGGNKQLKMQGDNYVLDLQQTLGYSFGGTIRKGVTKLIAFESGLNFTQRNFTTSMSLTDTNIAVTDKLSFISYEVPLNGLIYIQLGKQFYMNTSMGLALRFSPTDIKKITETGGIHSFINYGLYRSKIGFNLNGNVGFEFRTQKAGIFYLGGSICVPFKSILVLESIHATSQQTYQTRLIGNVAGNYLGLDLKYFFPTIKKQGEQPLNTPIE